MKRVIALILPALLMVSSVTAQEKIDMPVGILRHEMTPEELLRKGEIGRYFIETDPPVAPVRNVAEFDRMQGALVRFPFGIPISLIKEMAEDVTVTTIVASVSQKNTVISQYVANGVDTSHCDFLIAPTDSYWTRDYGPWFESDSANQIGIVDFPYNRPRPNDDEIPKKMAEMLGIPWFGMNVISTGGNYMTDGFGISSSTDLVWDENPTQTPAQIDQKMNSYLGIDNFRVVPDPNISSTIDHIDCWSKFLAPDKILIRKVLTNDPEYNALESAAAYWATQVSAYGYYYKVYRVMTPQDQPYTNSVILNNKALVPIMNSTWDDSAIAVYQAAMPGYEVIGFLGNPSAPWMSTDALHCRVMGIADIGLLHIRHIPITGNQPCETDYVINADIIASSHQPVKNDSVFVYYMVNGGPYQTALMLNTSENHYKGVIPKQAAGSEVRYYLFAADESGRHATAPLVGPGDPFSFNTVFTNLAPVPDTLWFITADDCLNGKITQLHNYLSSPVRLNAVQQNGLVIPWYVDSMSVSTLPQMLNPLDSFAIRVKMHLVVYQSPSTMFYTDSLIFSTSTGTYHVIIMVNHDLLTTAGEKTSMAELMHNYPNPFSHETTITMDIAQRGPVVLEIFDIRGTKVSTLLSAMLDPGTKQVKWDGTNADGFRLPEGIYLYRLTTGQHTLTKRMILQR